jgi:hypothetical protein
MAQYYNRYTDFNINGENLTVPNIKLPPKPSDKKVMYKVNQSRLDKISQQYYGTPYFGWLILQANPYVGGLEWNINDGQILIVPYPLVASLQSYKQAVDEYFFFYGKDVPMRTYSVPNIGNTPITQVTSTSTNTSSNGNNNVSNTTNGGTSY